MKKFYKDSDMIGLIYNYSPDTKDFEITFTPAETGKYRITFYEPGKCQSEKTMDGAIGEKVSLKFSDMTGKVFGVLRIAINS